MLLEQLLEKLTDYHNITSKKKLDTNTGQAFNVSKFKNKRNNTFYEKHIEGLEINGFSEAFQEILAYKVLSFANKFAKANRGPNRVIGELIPIPKEYHFTVKLAKNKDQYNTLALYPVVQTSGMSGEHRSAFDYEYDGEFSQDKGIQLGDYIKQRAVFANYLVGNDDMHGGNMIFSKNKTSVYMFDLGLSSFYHGANTSELKAVKNKLNKKRYPALFRQLKKLIYTYSDLVDLNSDRLLSFVDETWKEINAGIESSKYVRRIRKYGSSANKELNLLLDKEIKLTKEHSDDIRKLFKKTLSVFSNKLNKLKEVIGEQE